MNMQTNGSSKNPDHSPGYQSKVHQSKEPDLLKFNMFIQKLNHQNLNSSSSSDDWFGQLLFVNFLPKGYKR